MRSPLDDVPNPPSPELEVVSVRVLLVIVLVLLVFAAGYLYFLPNRPAEGYSTLAWKDTPTWLLDANSLSNTGLFVFSVELSSFELQEMLYRLVVEYDSRIIATKNVSLLPNARETIDFSIPVKGTLERDNELRVRVSKTNADLNEDKDDASLELVHVVTRD